MTTTSTRHEEADRAPVTVERSDVLDAVGGLCLMARDNRRQAKSRRYAGPSYASFRATLRDAADVYEAAAARMQRAADEVCS